MQRRVLLIRPLAACIAAVLMLVASAAAQVSQSIDAGAIELILSAEQMIQRDEFDSAITTLKKALPLAQKSNDDGYLAAITNRWLGLAYLRAGQVVEGHSTFDSAIDLFKRAGEVAEVLTTLKIAIALGRQMRLSNTQIRYLRMSADVQARLGNFEAQVQQLNAVMSLLALPADAALAREVFGELEAAYRRAGNEEGVAEALAGLGISNERTGDFDSALKYYARAIVVYRKLGRKELVAKLSNQSAEILRGRNRYQEALPLQVEALELRRALGVETDIAESLNNLALLKQELGNPEQAAQHIEECIRLTRKAGSKENLATSLTNAAAIYRDLGRFDEATTQLEEVFKIAKEEHLDDQTAAAGQILATIHYAKGDFLGAAAAAAASENFKSMKGSLEKSKVPEFDSYNLAIALIDLGKYEKAIEILEAKLRKAGAAHDEPKLVSVHEGLAKAYQASDRYTLALKHQIETVRIRRERNEPMGLARSLSNLGTIYLGMGRYYDAIDQYAEVTKIVSTLHAPQPQIETALAISHAYRHLKSYDLALDHAERAYTLAKQYGFGALVTRAQKTLAVIWLHLGNFKEAERLFSKAGKPEGGMSGVINDGMVEVYLATGRFKEAIDELSRVTVDELASANPGYRLQYYSQQGIASLGLNQPVDAMTAFSRAINQIDDIKIQFIGHRTLGFLDAGTYGGRIRPYRGIVETLADLHVSGAEASLTIDGEPHDLRSAAFHYSERMHSRYIVDQMASEEYAKMSEVMPESVQKEERRLVEQAEEVAAELAERKSRNEEITAEPQEALRKLQQSAREYFERMRKEHPQYALLFSPSISPKQIPLADDEVLLEYVIGLKSVFLFVIRNGKDTRLVRLPISVEDLDARVKVFRDLLVSRRFSPAIGKDLYDNLIGPALSYIGSSDALMIVPDGILGLLPFEALVTAHAKGATPVAFLGTKRRVSYTPSGTMLALGRYSTRSPAPRSFFGLADPIFGSDDPRFGTIPRQPTSTKADTGVTARTVWLTAFNRLKETQREVEELAAIMNVAPQPPDVLIGANANETILRKIDLGAYRVLHFATHARALGEVGRINEPFLVLGQVGNETRDDGLLAMSEIMNLKLNADLVVLAACDTGRGDIFGGDNVASLASAFQFAGARSVVLSLWELPSKPAILYTETFYRHLVSGHKTANALRLARDAMRDRYDDPYYWAVFVAYDGIRP